MRSELAKLNASNEQAAAELQALRNAHKETLAQAEKVAQTETEKFESLHRLSTAAFAHQIAAEAFQDFCKRCFQPFRTIHFEALWY